MLKRFIFFFLITVMSVSSASAQNSKAEATDKKPKSVVDFLMLLPNKYAANYAPKFREKYLKENGTTDVSNGYLEIFAPKENLPNLYVAIFKKDAGGYLITTASGIFGSEKPFKYNFLDYDGKNWIDVSKKVLPSIFKISDYTNGYGCELPRFNRTINCRDKDGKLIYLGWTGNDFVIE